MSDLIVLKLKNDEAFAVDSELLTSNSPVFDKLINQLHQTVLELDDFDIEVVTIFLTSLESKTLGNIELNQFRDLHKIPVVFNVSWMVSQCREYLVSLINDLAGKDYDHVLFLFEEARYIRDKWKSSQYINLLIYKMQSTGNASFIKKYMENFLNLSEKQLDLMMRLSGSDTEVLLGITKVVLDNNKMFDKNSKYLMENVNLPLAMEQNIKLYHETFDILVCMQDMSDEDSKLMLKLYMHSTKQYFSNKERNPRTTSLINLQDPWWWYRLEWSEFRDIEQAIDRFIEEAPTDLPPLMSMYCIIDVILVLAIERPDLLQDPVALVKKLEKESHERGWKRVNTRYSNHLLFTIEQLGIENKNNLRDCIEKMRDNETLTSYQNSIEVVCDISQRKEVNRSFFRKLLCTTTLLTYDNFMLTECKYPFLFKHPGITECTLPGNCGFLLKATPLPDRGFKFELCTEESEYPSDLHYHNIVSAEDMFAYLMLVHRCPDNSQVTYPIPLRYNRRYTWVYSWWVLSSQDEIKQLCVYYDISNYLAVKPK